MTIQFLIELRRRLLHSLVMFFFIFAGLLYFANPLYTALAKPLLKSLPRGHSLIATNIASSFFVPLELASVVAVFITMPFFFYQLWAFIVPALYRHEKSLIWPLLLASIVLFYLGALFAYFVIFPLIFGFLTKSVPQGIQIAPDMGLYLDFALKLLLSFGIIFEVPVITIFIIKVGLVKRETLIKTRPYVIVAAFILGMLVAPPDVLSQTLLAVPLWLLFEIGIFLSPYVSGSFRQH